MSETHISTHGQGKNGTARFPSQEPISRVSLVPPRLIHGLVDLKTLPPQDRLFYERDLMRSQAFIAQESQRRAFVGRQPCLILKFRCMDEKEADTEENLGIPCGASNSIEIAGNLIGDGNLRVNQEIQKRILQASAMNKVVLSLFITHESERLPHEDSCAAWGQDIAKANAHAVLQVSRLNEDGVDRIAHGSIVRRNLVAVHITSVTDTECRIWCGQNERVNPMDFVQENGGSVNPRADLEGEALVEQVRARFAQAFPRRDERFEGLTTPQWEAVIGQMAEMCTHNIGVVREMVRKNLPTRKSGHKGTRLLVGRGWKMYSEVNKWFRVSDLSPDDVLRRQVQIACKYMLRNDFLLLLRKGYKRGPKLSMHVNTPYNDEEVGDRSTSIRHSMGMARFVKSELVDLMQTPARRAEFDSHLRQALEAEGITWDELPQSVRSAYAIDPLSGLRLYVSVSARKCCALELVATNKDL